MAEIQIKGRNYNHCVVAATFRGRGAHARAMSYIARDLAEVTALTVDGRVPNLTVFTRIAGNQQARAHQARFRALVVAS
ncbi:MAG: hypothetical protein WC277_10135 [Bacilli bacterium]